MQSFEVILSNSWDIFLKSIKKMLVVLFLTFVTLTILFFLGIVFYIVSQSYFIQTGTPRYLILIYNFITSIALFVLHLVLAALFQIPMISIVLDPSVKLKKIISNIKDYFWRIVLFTFFLYLCEAILFIPFILIFVAVYLNFPFLMLFVGGLIAVFVALGILLGLSL